MRPPAAPRWVTLAEAAAALGCDEAEAERLLARAQILPHETISVPVGPLYGGSRTRTRGGPWYEGAAVAKLRALADLRARGGRG